MRRRMDKDTVVFIGVGLLVFLLLAGLLISEVHHRSAHWPESVDGMRYRTFTTQDGIRCISVAPDLWVWGSGGISCDWHH
jgi:hypothetical protein